MIHYVYKEEDEESPTFVTTGCGCCSTNLYLPDDKEQIMKELRRNVVALKDVCKELDIDIIELIKNN